MTIDILPCPFCGCDAEFDECEHTEPLFCIECPDCDFSLLNGPVGIGWFGTKEDAAISWNRRA